MIDNEAVLEDKEGLGIYERWMEEIKLSKEAEKDWRGDAELAITTYRSERKKTDNADSPKKESFNILWANVETKSPALYNSLPRPSIRRRHKDKDKLGRAISEILERCVTYVIDVEDMDTINKAAVGDMLLPGRAVTRVKYIPTMIPGEPDGSAPSEESMESPEEEYSEEAPSEVVGDQQIRFDQVQYDAFHRGPGKSWDEVPWVSYEHKFTKEMVAEKWPDAKGISYSITVSSGGKEDKDLDETDSSIFKRCLIHEIWDKEAREVIWIAEGKEEPLEIVPDPLGLKGFFDCPRPLYAIESSTSLIPICEYSQYQILAKELENLTTRIGKIISAIRVRGIYDSTMPEIGKLFDADDTEFIPAEGLSRLLEENGLDNAIWMLPIDKLVATLQILKEQRRELVQEIYEITGISDIQRGSSNPHETKGAQEIKATFGGQRLKRQQEDVQRYLRDLIRLSVEIIAENFSRETLTAMSGISFPTNQDKQVAKQIMQQAQQFQQMAKQAQQMGQPAPQPPDQRRVQWAQKTLQKVTWEEIEAEMSSDLKRQYRIDVETGSTIQDELQQDQQARTELLTSMGQFLQVVAPAMQAKLIDHAAAKEIMLSTVRSAKMGRDVEDAIENMQPPKNEPSPEQQKMQAEMKIQEEEGKRAQETHQMDMQMKQIDAKIAQQKAQLEAQKLQMEAQAAQASHQMEMETLRLKNEYEQASHKRKMRELNEPQRAHG